MWALSSLGNYFRFVSQDICRVGLALSGNTEGHFSRIRPPYLVEEMRWRMVWANQAFEPDACYKTIQELGRGHYYDFRSGTEKEPAKGGQHYSGWPCVQFTGRQFGRKKHSTAVKDVSGPSGEAFGGLLDHLRRKPCSILFGENARGPVILDSSWHA